MKILGISGSPRPEGNTVSFLKKALEESEALGAQTNLISLSNKSIRGCRGCYGCVQEKECVLQDDFQEVFQAMLEADGILLGSPSYHSSITPELKAVLDRGGFSGRWACNKMAEKDRSYAWKGTVFSGKVVAPVVVARRAGQNVAFSQILLWAACNDCIIPGNTYWNMGIAGKGGAYDAEADQEGMDIMRNLGQRMVDLIHRLENEIEGIKKG